MPDMFAHVEVLIMSSLLLSVMSPVAHMCQGSQCHLLSDRHFVPSIVDGDARCLEAKVKSATSWGGGLENGFDM